MALKCIAEKNCKELINICKDETEDNIIYIFKIQKCINAQDEFFIRLARIAVKKDYVRALIEIMENCTFIVLEDIRINQKCQFYIHLHNKNLLNMSIKMLEFASNDYKKYKYERFSILRNKYSPLVSYLINEWSF